MKKSKARTKSKIKVTAVAGKKVKKKGPLVIKATKGSIAANTQSSGKAKINPTKVSQLKGASYNPRVITENELRKLKYSYEQFGDLSGVVFNVASAVLISGHQRLKTVQDKKPKLVKQKYKDSHGTVAIGYIEAKSKDGKTTRIPYREVNWSDKKTEIAANIAANAHGGSFDEIKLGGLLHKLSQEQFDIELTGIDELSFQKMRIKHRNMTGGKSGSGSTGDSDKRDEDGFSEIGKSDIRETDHKCPRCGYLFDSAKTKKSKDGKRK